MLAGPPPSSYGPHRRWGKIVKLTPSCTKGTEENFEPVGLKHQKRRRGGGGQGGPGGGGGSTYGCQPF